MTVLFMDALGLSAKMESELVGSSPPKVVNFSRDKLKHERSTNDDSLWDGVDRDDEMIHENNSQPLSPSLFNCGRIISDTYKNSNVKKGKTLNAKPRNILVAFTSTKEEDDEYDDELSFGSLCSDEVEKDDESSSPLFACGRTACDAYETSDDEASFTLSTTNAKQRKAATAIQNRYDDDNEMSFGSSSSEEAGNENNQSYSGSLVTLSEKIPERQEEVVGRHSSGSENSNPLVDESRSQNSGGHTMRKDGSQVVEPRDVILVYSLRVIEREQEQESPAPSAGTKNRIWKKKRIFSSFKKTTKKKSADTPMASKG